MVRNRYYTYFDSNIHVIIETSQQRLTPKIIEEVAPQIAKQMSENPAIIDFELKNRLMNNQIEKVIIYEEIGQSVRIHCRVSGVLLSKYRVIYVIAG